MEISVIDDICKCSVVVPKRVGLDLVQHGFAYELADGSVRWEASKVIRKQSCVSTEVPQSCMAALLEDLKAFVRTITHTSAGIHYQALQIVAKYVEWKPNKDYENKLRHDFPFQYNMILVKSFDRFMEVRRLKANTRTLYMHALSKVLNMVQPASEGELDYDNVLLGIFRSGLFPQLQELPILSTAYASTRHVVVALGHFAIMTKLRLQASGNMHDAHSIDQIIQDILKPWGKHCTAAQKQGSHLRYVQDAKTIEEYHSPDKLKAIAYGLYLDLMTIHHAVCVEGKQLTHTILFKAISCSIFFWLWQSSPCTS